MPSRSSSATAPINPINSPPTNAARTIGTAFGAIGPFGSSLFGTTFFILTGFHGCHVLSGVIYLLITLMMAGKGSWGYAEVEITGLYWHFVDLIWILVFTFVYLI